MNTLPKRAQPAYILYISPYWILQKSSKPHPFSRISCSTCSRFLLSLPQPIPVFSHLLHITIKHMNQFSFMSAFTVPFNIYPFLSSTENQSYYLTYARFLTAGYHCYLNPFSRISWISQLPLNIYPFSLNQWIVQLLLFPFSLIS